MKNWDPELEHGRLCRPGEHPCKFCGCPVDQAIEGELVCPDCWTGRQLDTRPTYSIDPRYDCNPNETD